MADIDLKTETPDTTLPTDGFLFGADSQSAASPSVYPVANAITTFVGNLQSSDLLAWNSDTILARRAAANLQLGAADAAAPVAQTLSVQSVVAGTSNTAGANLTIAGSQGTGTGAGGSIVFQVAPAGTTGTAQNALETFAEMTSARAFNLYNTTDVTTNFERAKFAWESDILRIGTAKGGTGTARALELQTDGTTRLTIATDGAATFSSTVTAQNLANGRTLQRFTPLDNQPPATNFATLDTRNSVALLDFDDGATNEEAVFVGVIPESATLTSGIKVRIFWAATTATSGDVEWGAQFEKYGTDIDSDSFDTATFAITTTSGTSGIVNVTEITCTTIDSLAAGDQFRLKIVRNSSDTTDDTMTGDAELVAVELQQVA